MKYNQEQKIAGCFITVLLAGLFIICYAFDKKIESVQSDIVKSETDILQQKEEIKESIEKISESQAEVERLIVTQQAQKLELDSIIRSVILLDTKTTESISKLKSKSSAHDSAIKLLDSRVESVELATGITQFETEDSDVTASRGF